MEYTTLNNGVKMPMIGFGVFQVPDAKQAEVAVSDTGKSTIYDEMDPNMAINIGQVKIHD